MNPTLLTPAHLTPATPLADPMEVYLHDDGTVGDKYHSMKELYNHRCMLQALLFNTWGALGLYNVHRSWRHHPDDNPMFESDDPEQPYFVVVAELPTGQLTNHYKAYKWELFRDVPERRHAVKWDGKHGLAEGMVLLAQTPVGPSSTFSRLEDDIEQAVKATHY